MSLNREEKQQIIEKFAINSGDTGSAEVQIALLTTNIQRLTDHCKKHPSDFSSKRGLIKMVCNRRKFLRYLEQSDIAKYKQILERLGLRK